MLLWSFLLGVAGLVGFSGVAVRVQGIQSIQGLELQGFGLRIPLVRHALGARDAKLRPRWLVAGI